MQPSARENYLVADVMTAPPQKLQLLLIETAIRLVERTKQHWRAGENDSACETLIRAQEIVAQILAGLNRELAPALVAKVTAVYLFVYRNLLESGPARDERKLDEALRVLREERTTWHEICRQLGTPVTGHEEPAEPRSSRLSLDA